MAQDREPFLRRWSRRKLEEAQKPAQPADAPAPELPSIDSLTSDSDYSVFMHEKVDEKLRRAALKKLFSDPSFNVVDGLDDYAEDFTQLESLAEGAAAGLEHAKRTLLGRDPDLPTAAETTVEETAQAQPAETRAEPERLAQDAGRDEAAAAREDNALPPRADAEPAKKG